MEAPQVFILPLIALEVPGVVVERVVAHAHVVCGVDAAAILAGKGALSAGASNASRVACVCSFAAARGGDGAHANLLIPVGVGAGGLGVVVAVGLLEDELLTGLAGKAGVSAAASAVVVAGAGSARGVVEDGALDSAQEPRHAVDGQGEEVGGAGGGSRCGADGRGQGRRQDTRTAE
jgi:hypothetical protein